MTDPFSVGLDDEEVDQCDYIAEQTEPDPEDDVDEPWHRYMAEPDDDRDFDHEHLVVLDGVVYSRVDVGF